MSGFVGALLFLLVCGAALLVLLVLIAGGLRVAWRERNACRALAAALGCRYPGSCRYEGEVAGVSWRAEVFEDSDSARCWAEFNASSQQLGMAAREIDAKWMQALGIAPARVRLQCQHYALHLGVEDLKGARSAEMQSLLRTGTALLAELLRPGRSA